MLSYKWIIGLLLLLCSPVFAEKTAKPATPISPMYWSVNTVIDGYIQQMTRYYNLTPQQQDYTRELMGQRVKRFLEINETDVRWLAAEIFDYQLKRELPPPEIAKEWASRARPLMAAIRREVLDGNMKWREVLNDQQKQQHDNDLQLMKKEFDSYDKKIDRWSKGEVLPGDFPGAISNEPRTIRKSEDAWEYYVRNFIQVYNLNDGQKQTAYSILRQLREEAARYRESHKEDYAQLEKEDAEASKAVPTTQPEKLKASIDSTKLRTDHRRELDKPIAEMFERLKTQLYVIPTAEQRRARDMQLDNMDAMARGRPVRKLSGGSRPAAIPAAPVAPAAPAGSRPAQPS